MKTPIDLHETLKQNELGEALIILEPHFKNFSLTRRQCAILWWYNHEKRINAMSAEDRKLVKELVDGVK